MGFSSWRGTLGMVHPTLRPGSTEEFIRLAPEGIGVIPMFLNISRGTRDEFEKVFAAYEGQIKVCAEAGCDLIHPSGAPPFMVQGLKREAEIVKGWEDKFGVPIFTSGQNHITAMRALGAKTIVGATYFPGDINQTFARYFQDAGFDVKCMEGIDVPFDRAQELSGEQVYGHIKKAFLRAGGGDVIYMLGSGWRVLNIIHLLEQDLGVPVIHPVPARVWEVQRRLHINEPKKGYGVLLETMPPLPK